MGFLTYTPLVQAMRDDLHELPTPWTTLRARYVRVLVWCKSCRHQRDADLQALIDAGRGDVPLVQIKWRCVNCGSPDRIHRGRLASAAAVSGDEIPREERS